MGCKITIIDVNNEALENSKKEFKKMGFSNVEAFKCDVTDRENVEKTIKKSVKLDYFEYFLFHLPYLYI